MLERLITEASLGFCLPIRGLLPSTYGGPWREKGFHVCVNTNVKTHSDTEPFIEPIHQGSTRAKSIPDGKPWCMLLAMTECDKRASVTC